MNSLVHKQSNLIGLLLSSYLKFPIVLVPDPKVPPHLPQIFRMHGPQGNLSEENRSSIILWFMSHHPDFVIRWWSDAAIQGNLLDMNADNELYVHEIYLVTLLMALHPQTKHILDSLSDIINSKFSHLTEPSFQRLRKILGFKFQGQSASLVNSVFLHGELVNFEGPHCNESLVAAITQLLEQQQKEPLLLWERTSLRKKTQAVHCFNPEGLFSFEGELKTFDNQAEPIRPEQAVEQGYQGPLYSDCKLYLHLHRGLKFLVQMSPEYQLNSLAIMSSQLNLLHSALNLPMIDFLPVQNYSGPLQAPSYVSKHEGLSKTGWYILHATFTTDDHPTNLLTQLDIEGEPEWVTQARGTGLPNREGSPVRLMARARL